MLIVNYRHKIIIVPYFHCFVSLLDVSLNKMGRRLRKVNNNLECLAVACFNVMFQHAAELVRETHKNPAVDDYY
jgi:hypothetical protein